MTDIITRKDYIGAIFTTKEDATERHRAYYAQFVTQATLDAVGRRFGQRLLKSPNKDGCYNDIDLAEWDAFCGIHQSRRSNGDITIYPGVLPFDKELLFEAHGSRTWSPSDLVCVAKEAARMWVEEFREEHG